MFWGCFSKLGRGILVTVEGKRYGKKYLKTFKDHLLPEAQYLMNQGNQVLIMHDGAPGHRWSGITDYLEDTDFDMLDWPPYSPDLNPIENLWALLKYRLYSDYPTAATKEDLIDYVMEIWESFDLELCEKYCNDYHKRLLAVLKAKGLQTKY